jgi:hypothetical protein
MIVVPHRHGTPIDEALTTSMTKVLRHFVYNFEEEEATMRQITKDLCISTLAAFLVGVTSTQAMAQHAPIQFRVVPTDRNPSSCQQWDAELARVHTFTPTASAATFRTASGISRNMTQTTPNVYTTTLAVGGTNFNVTADTSKSPKTLEVAEPRTGCRWNAVAP